MSDSETRQAYLDAKPCTARVGDPARLLETDIDTRHGVKDGRQAVAGFHPFGQFALQGDSLAGREIPGMFDGEPHAGIMMMGMT